MAVRLQQFIDKSIKHLEAEQAKRDMAKLIKEKYGINAEYDVVNQLYKIANKEGRWLYAC